MEEADFDIIYYWEIGTGKHAVKHFTSVFTGEAINNKFSMGLLKFMTGPLLDFMYFFRLHRYNYKDLEL